MSVSKTTSRNVAGSVSSSAPRLARFARGLFAPVDIDFLAYFRVLFGLLMMYQVLSYFAVQPNGQTIITNFYLRPFHFTYAGFEWVRPWPGGGMYLHFIIMAVLAAGIMIGFLYRFCAALFCLGWVYLFLLDKAYYQNHYYLVCLLTFWMTMLPAHRAFSLDAAMRPAIRAATVPAWTLWVLRLQIGIPYFFGGLAKLNHDWLHGEPMRNWIYLGKYSYIPDELRQEWVVYAFTYGGLLFDLLVVPALLWRRTRWVACVLALCFHVSNGINYLIGIFPWLMLGSTILYFPPGTLRRFFGGWSEVEGSKPPAERISFKQRLIVVLLTVYFAFQAVWPLRQHLYPGDAGWTGEGDLFSWRMMLYSKDRQLVPQFESVDPQTGSRTSIDVGKFLNQTQLWAMKLCPEMIPQFARFLQREILVPSGQEGSRGQLEVHARIPVMYNGRKPQLLVDPRVDLAAVDISGWKPAEWILPLEEPLPAPESVRSRRLPNGVRRPD